MNRAKQLWAAEPAVVSMGVSAALGWAASFLVLHGVVSNTVASATVQEVTPSLVAGVLFAIGVFVRQFVSPAVLRVEQWAAAEVPSSLLKPAVLPAVALTAPTASGSVGSAYNTAQIPSEPVVPATDVARFTG